MCNWEQSASDWDNTLYPLVMCSSLLLKMTIETVSFPSKHGYVHTYVNVYQRGFVRAFIPKSQRWKMSQRSSTEIDEWLRVRLVWQELWKHVLGKPLKLSQNTNSGEKITPETVKGRAQVPNWDEDEHIDTFCVYMPLPTSPDLLFYSLQRVRIGRLSVSQKVPTKATGIGFPAQEGSVSRKWGYISQIPWLYSYTQTHC